MTLDELQRRIDAELTNLEYALTWLRRHQTTITLALHHTALHDPDGYPTSTPGAGTVGRSKGTIADPSGTAAAHLADTGRVTDPRKQFLPRLALAYTHLAEARKTAQPYLAAIEDNARRAAAAKAAATPCTNTNGCPDNNNGDPSRGGRCSTCAGYRYRHNLTDRTTTRKAA